MMDYRDFVFEQTFSSLEIAVLQLYSIAQDSLAAEG